MRVVFMGTPQIAADCLSRLIADGFDLVGVYTEAGYAEEPRHEARHVRGQGGRAGRQPAGLSARDVPR